MRLRKNQSIILLFCVFSFFARVCSAETPSVLFVGNSFTFVNNMPKLFSSISESLGNPVEVDMAAPGGYTLESHSRDNATKMKIRSRDWTFVVLQEQSQRPAFPPAQTESQVIPYALQLDQIIHTNNATTKTVFFETWGYKAGDARNCAIEPEICAYEGMQHRLTETYSLLAQKTSGMLAPVGTAWKMVRLTHPEIELYANDGIHPSMQGSYLAACVFYATLFKKGVMGANKLGLDSSQANILQRAAQEAVFHPDSAARQ